MLPFKEGLIFLKKGGDGSKGVNNISNNCIGL